MTSDQISFSYSQEFPKQIEHNTHMFKEDLSRHLFPIRNNKDIQFTLSPHNPTLEKQIAP